MPTEPTTRGPHERLQIEQDPAGTVVVSGEIDPSNAERLRRSLAELRGEGPLVVDLQNVTYLDSAGVSALFDAAHADLHLLVRADTAVATVIRICALPLVAHVEYVPAPA
jgi:anti-anti-sigma factor